tara:strand:+ start:553 stop:1974 length:1422 start_codon:yes stop_codon:yes gene_type:complete
MIIKFGTDGWRAIIGEEFTFERVRYCAQGTANYMHDQGLSSRGIVIGYDTRFASKEFADACAEVMIANGIKTFLCKTFSPTPVITHHVIDLNAGGGIVITASHNPGNYNGFKFKLFGSVSPEITNELESSIQAVEQSQIIKTTSLDHAKNKRFLEYTDPYQSYFANVRSLINIDLIKNSNLNIQIDSMFGAGIGLFKQFLSGGNSQISEINNNINPAFPGISQPEPIASNLRSLSKMVKNNNSTIGLATDGDADRLGVIDENGNYVSSLNTFSILCLHLLDNLQLRAPIVRSITMTSMIDKIGDIYGVKVFDTPVGFKHLAPVMIEQKAMIAGEESGGYAFGNHVPERDGVFSGLILLEMIALSGLSMSELTKMLFEKIGSSYYDRIDIKLEKTQQKNEDVINRVENANPQFLANRKVLNIDKRDGYRFQLENDFWALIRFSGTEPLLRIYAEGESLQETQNLLQEMRTIAKV